MEHIRDDKPDRYHKIGYDQDAIERLFVALFLEAYNQLSVL